MFYNLFTEKTKKCNKKSKYIYWKRLAKFRLITIPKKRMKGYLIKTFKMINGNSNYGCIFFKYISPRTRIFLPKQI